MATGYDIVNRALRLCRVLDAGDAAGSNEAQDALDTLNDMLAELHEAEVGLPDYSMATLETALASDAADSEALSYALALRIAPEYGVELLPTAQQTAAEVMARMRLRYFQPVKVDAALPSSRDAYSVDNE